MITELYGVAIVPVIIGIVAVIVQIFPEFKKYGGIVSLLLGLSLSFAYGLTEAGWSVLQCVIVGAGLGLAATGLYSTSKNVIEEPK